MKYTMQETNENIQKNIEENKNNTTQTEAKYCDLKSIQIRKEPTINEKIDFIYKTLKTQQRNNRIKLTLKMLIFLWILYFVFIYVPQMTQSKIDELKSNITSIISEQISSFARPIIKDLTQDFMEEKTQNVKESVIDIKNKIIK